MLLFQSTPDRRPRDIKSLKLKGVDKKLAETILNEIIDTGPPVTFADIGETSGSTLNVHC